jgi:hypothetical protein
VPNPKSNGPRTGFYFFKNFNREDDVIRPNYFKKIIRPNYFKKEKDASPEPVDDALLKKLRIQPLW